MGHCQYINHNTNKSIILCNFMAPKENNSENQTEVISQINTNSLNSKNINEEMIRLMIEKNIPLGVYISINDYKNQINEKIFNYIENHKLNYQYYHPSSFNSYKSNPIQFKNGNIYYGSWNANGEMEGYGIYLIKEKNTVVEGIWEKGNNIYGRIFIPNGDMYEGEIKNSLPHGKGYIYFSNKEIYKGDFVNGEMTGIGTFIYKDGSYYCGKIEKGSFNGEGSLKWNNETEYHGNFTDSTISGKGKMFNNILGEKYVGNFDKNEFHGKGVYSYKNGDIYDGNFEYGIKKGKGIYKRFGGVEFDLEWDDDLPNGKGFVKYKNNTLEGLWRNGKIINKKIIKGDIDIFKDIDLNIKPIKECLFLSSLPHLNTVVNETSQSISKTEWNF